MRRGNKYGARKANCSQGHTHDSKREAARCDALHKLEANGYITDLELQPQFFFVIDGKQLKHDNGRRVGLKADFLYTDCVEGIRVVEDAKPPNHRATGRDWPIRKALFKALNPHLELREV
jgi:hypothetical protein